MRRHQHHDREPDRDRRLLPEIQPVQRDLGPHIGAFVALHGSVVAPRLMRLVAEILHRLEVQQAVHRAGVGFLVRLVHRAAEADAPFGEHQRPGDVDADRHQDHRGEAEVEHPPQDQGDQQDLEDRGHDVEQQEVQHEGHAPRAAFDHPRQPARLPVQVEAQRQAMQMREDAERDAPHGAALHLGEDRVPRLVEEGGQQPRQAIAQHQRDRHRHQRPRHAGARAALRRQRIHRAGEGQGHQHIRPLGEDQQPEAGHHPRAQPPFPLRPQIGDQRQQRPQMVALIPRRGRLGLGGRRHAALRRGALAEMWRCCAPGEGAGRFPAMRAARYRAA